LRLRRILRRGAEEFEKRGGSEIRRWRDTDTTLLSQQGKKKRFYRRIKPSYQTRSQYSELKDKEKEVNSSCSGEAPALNRRRK